MIRHFAIFIVGLYVRIFYRHKAYGLEHIPKGGAIIAGNHASFIDPPLIGVSCPQEVHFLARDTLFKFKPFGWLIKQLNTHPVAKGKGNLATFKKACEMIDSGMKVVIFPEGTRTKDGEFQKGQLGVGMLIMRSPCVVVPVYIYGTYDIWSANHKFPRLTGKTACVFGSPLDFRNLEGDDRKALQQHMVDKTMEAIVHLKEWYLAGARGTPP